MALVKVLEILAESDKGWDDAARKSLPRRVVTFDPTYANQPRDRPF